jgi:hypothetical protein
MRLVPAHMGCLPNVLILSLEPERFENRLASGGNHPTPTAFQRSRHSVLPSASSILGESPST